jgi:hypothetical protein
VLRQSELARYNFNCDCERCSDPSDDWLINGYICRQKVTGNFWFVHCFKNCGGILVEEENNLVCEKCSNKVVKILYDKAKEKIEQYHSEGVLILNKVSHQQLLMHLNQKTTKLL